MRGRDLFHFFRLFHGARQAPIWLEMSECITRGVSKAFFAVIFFSRTPRAALVDELDASGFECARNDIKRCAPGLIRPQAVWVDGPNRRPIAAA